GLALAQRGLELGAAPSLVGQRALGRTRRAAGALVAREIGPFEVTDAVDLEGIRSEPVPDRVLVVRESHEVTPPFQLATCDFRLASFELPGERTDLAGLSPGCRLGRKNSGRRRRGQSGCECILPSGRKARPGPLFRPRFWLD